MAARKGRQWCARIVAPGRQTIGGCWLHRLGTSSPRCLSLLSLPPFFFLFISSLDHSPPRPSSPFPATHFSCRLFQTADLTYHPLLPTSPPLSLSLSRIRRRPGKKKVLLVFPSASPIECDVVNEGRRGLKGGHGYSLLFLPPPLLTRPLPSFRFVATTCLFFSKPVSSLFFLLLPDTFPPPLTLSRCLVVALLAAGHFIVVALDATTWLGFSFSPPFLLLRRGSEIYMCARVYTPAKKLFARLVTEEACLRTLFTPPSLARDGLTRDLYARGVRYPPERGNSYFVYFF